MKTILRRIVTMAVVGLGSTQALAVLDLQISVQATNAILSWPSLAGDAYIVQYRSNLNANTAWTTLASAWPAAAGTNRTQFVHTNIVKQVSSGGGSGGGSGAPPAPPSVAQSTEEERAMLKEKRENGRKHIPLPPAPWDPHAFAPIKDRSATPMTADPMSGSGDSPDMAFYRVVKTGLTFPTVSSGATISEYGFLPVEVGLDNGKLKSLSLFVDGNPFPFADAISEPFTGPYLGFWIDTGFLSNTVHSIYLAAGLYTGGDAADLSAWQTVFGDTIQVGVFNEISFPEWQPFFGEEIMPISFYSAHPNVNWEMDLYGTNDQYIVTLGGQSSGGVVRVGWDFTDFAGVRHDDASFSGLVYTPYTQNSPPPLPFNRRRKDNFPTKGDWVVVNQRAWSGYTGSDLLDAMTDAWFPSITGRALSVLPVNPQDPGEAYRIGIGQTAAQDWAQLKAALTNFNSRNFYYFGHGGGGDRIGGYTNETATLGLTKRQIADLLSQKWDLHIGGLVTNHHDFRFAFIDGCESATGDLQKAFGVYATGEKDLTAYMGIRPSAYVGWAAGKVIAVANTIQTYHPNFIAHFLFEWNMNGKPLRRALTDAASYSDTAGINIGTIRVHGYKDLGFNDYNTR